jgi:protein tyrosine phosphatase (PTP) superfamily phosphohydrolase (DUF442 family)
MPLKRIGRTAIGLSLTAGVLLFAGQAPGLAAPSAPSQPALTEKGAGAATLSQAAPFIPNLAIVAPNFFRGGQPSYDGLRKLKAAGVKVDVCLDNERSYIADESQQAQALGLKFVSIPLNAFRHPTDMDILRFLDITARKDSEPLFVHCVHGRDRTGAMVAIYREVKEHIAPDVAYQEMLEHGFRPMFKALTDTVFSVGTQLGMSGHKPKFGFMGTHLAG